MDPLAQEQALDQLVEKTKALNWGITSPPSWKDPIEAESAASLILVGRVVSEQEIPLHVVRRGLQKAWPFAQNLVVSEQARNIFLFEFSSAEACAKVLSKQPWNVKENLVLLQPWLPDIPWQDIDLHHYSVWVQIHGFPLDCSNGYMAKFVGDAIGKVLELEGDPQKRIWCVPFIRARILLDIRHSISSGYMLLRNALPPLKIVFKYEHLIGFCYKCGLVGHL